MTYRENIGGSTAAFTGPVEAAGRTLCALLRTRHDAIPVFLSFYQPGTPASALAGIMAGSTYLAQEARPTICRFAAVQVPRAAEVDASNRYFECKAGALTQDLLGLGLPDHAAAEAEWAVLTLLRDGTAMDQIALTEQTCVAQSVDRGWLLQASARAGRV